MSGNSKKQSGYQLRRRFISSSLPTLPKVVIPRSLKNINEPRKMENLMQHFEARMEKREAKEFGSKSTKTEAKCPSSEADARNSPVCDKSCIQLPPPSSSQEVRSNPPAMTVDESCLSENGNDFSQPLDADDGDNIATSLYTADLDLSSGMLNFSSPVVADGGEYESTAVSSIMTLLTPDLEPNRCTEMPPVCTAAGTDAAWGLEDIDDFLKELPPSDTGIVSKASMISGSSVSQAAVVPSSSSAVGDIKPPAVSTVSLASSVCHLEGVVSVCLCCGSEKRTRQDAVAQTDPVIIMPTTRDAGVQTDRVVTENGTRTCSTTVNSRIIPKSEPRRQRSDGSSDSDATWNYPLLHYQGPNSSDEDGESARNGHPGGETGEEPRQREMENGTRTCSTTVNTRIIPKSEPRRQRSDDSSDSDATWNPLLHYQGPNSSDEDGESGSQSSGSSTEAYDWEREPAGRRSETAAGRLVTVLRHCCGQWSWLTCSHCGAERRSDVPPGPGRPVHLQHRPCHRPSENHCPSSCLGCERCVMSEGRQRDWCPCARKAAVACKRRRNEECCWCRSWRRCGRSCNEGRCCCPNHRSREDSPMCKCRRK